MQYVICDLQYIVYIYMLCRYIIYNTAEVYPMFIYFVYVNSTSTIRRRSWSCHRRPGAADNSSCRPKLKLSGFQDLPELFSKVYSPVSTCIIHLYNIYICIERERETERGKSGSSSGIRQPSNTPVVQNTQPRGLGQSPAGEARSTLLLNPGRGRKGLEVFLFVLPDKKCHVSPN